MGSMDMFLNPNENDLDQLQNLGNIPMNNNFGKTETYLKQKLGSIPNLNYPDPIAPSSSPEGEGYRYAYGRLPCVPFTKFVGLNSQS